MEALKAASGLAQYGTTGAMIAMVLLCAWMAWIIYKIFDKNMDIIAEHSKVTAELVSAVTDLKELILRK